MMMMMIMILEGGLGNITDGENDIDDDVDDISMMMMIVMMMMMMKIKVMDDDFDNIIDKVDEDGSKTLDFDEFMEMMAG